MILSAVQCAFTKYFLEKLAWKIIVKHSSFSEELLLESQKLCNQLENVMHDTMKDQEQSFMVNA